MKLICYRNSLTNVVEDIDGRGEDLLSREVLNNVLSWHPWPQAHANE